MSKEAALRAMREAHFRARTTGSDPAPRVARPAVRPIATEALAPPAASDGLCGHRSKDGRTCTREQGHAAKSHRYASS